MARVPPRSSAANAVGNPIDVMIAPDVTQEIREQTIRAYGFDLPLWQQYGIFLQRLASGDFGRSFVYNMPVLDLILSRLPVGRVPDDAAGFNSG